MNSRILFFSMPNIHAFLHMQILNMMHFSYIITYSKVTIQLFLGNILSRIIFQNVFNPKQHLCNMVIFQKIPKKSYLSQEANQFYLNRAPRPKQTIQLLGPSPRISKPRNTMIKPINNKAYHKVPSNLSP